MKDNSKNKKNKGLIIFFAIIAIIYVIIYMFPTERYQCIETGCRRRQEEGSFYCQKHQYLKESTTEAATTPAPTIPTTAAPATTQTTKKSTTYKTYKPKTTTAPTTSAYSSKKKSSSSSSSSSKKKKKTYVDTYDDGYNDVYMNEEYDDERYRTDEDYALGVDDAMDEMGEDW